MSHHKFTLPVRLLTYRAQVQLLTLRSEVILQQLVVQEHASPYIRIEQNHTLRRGRRALRRERNVRLRPADGLHFSCALARVGDTRPTVIRRRAGQRCRHVVVIVIVMRLHW